MTKALKEAVDALAAQVIGEDPMLTEAIGEKLLEIGGRGAAAGLVTRAVSAIDVALWDLKGKILGQPVWKLLGGFRNRVPAYASGHLWRTYDADALARKGAELVEQGFRAMKFRMGAEPSNTAEMDRMHALCDAVGDEIDIMVDINRAGMSTARSPWGARWSAADFIGWKIRSTTRISMAWPASPMLSTRRSPRASICGASNRSGRSSSGARSTL